ncbi:hypothetical protein T484DRAFT_1918404, partial [Baffinella frigidus]
PRGGPQRKSAPHPHLDGAGPREAPLPALAAVQHPRPAVGRAFAPPSDPRLQNRAAHGARGVGLAPRRRPPRAPHPHPRASRQQHPTPRGVGVAPPDAVGPGRGIAPGPGPALGVAPAAPPPSRCPPLHPRESRASRTPRAAPHWPRSSCSECR